MLPILFFLFHTLGKILKESESDPDDPDSVEDTDHELAEDESNGIAEGTEASCSLEGAQNGDSISKAYSIKHKRKRKMKDAAEQSEEEIVTEQPEKDDDIEKSECKVHQHNKGKSYTVWASGLVLFKADGTMLSSLSLLLNLDHYITVAKAEGKNRMKKLPQ